MIFKQNTRYSVYTSDKTQNTVLFAKKATKDGICIKVAKNQIKY